MFVYIHSGPGCCGRVALMAGFDATKLGALLRSGDFYLPNGQHPESETLLECGACGRQIRTTELVVQELIGARTPSGARDPRYGGAMWGEAQRPRLLAEPITRTVEHSMAKATPKSVRRFKILWAVGVALILIGLSVGLYYA